MADIVEKLRMRMLVQHGGPRGMDYGWNLQEHDSEMHRDAADEIERLRAFARDVLNAWPHGGVDGCDLQDYAEKQGLLVPETRTAPCGEDGACNCADYYDTDEWTDGITCYRRVEWLRGAYRLT